MTLGNDNGTDRQTDRRTDRVRRIMRPPPREEGRIITTYLESQILIPVNYTTAIKLTKGCLISSFTIFRSKIIASFSEVHLTYTLYRPLPVRIS